MPTMTEVVFQSIIAFILLFILARLMGKRQIAQLTFFDYIAGITIGNIAATWSLDDTKSSHAVISILIWTVFSIVLAWIQRKSYKARILLDGRPTVLIQNGKVLENNLSKVNIAIDEMMLLLREKNVFKISDVEYAVFETNGSISVMKKSELQPVTPKDLGVPVIGEHEPRILVIDGHVMERSLQEAGYSKAWLLGELMKQGATDFNDVFLAQVDSNGNVYVDLYYDKLQQQQIKQKPLLAASLKKMQADLESFALQTQDPHAKQSYAKMTEQLKHLINDMLPYLKE